MSLVSINIGQRDMETAVRVLSGMRCCELEDTPSAESLFWLAYVEDAMAPYDLEKPQISGATLVLFSYHRGSRIPCFERARACFLAGPTFQNLSNRETYRKYLDRKSTYNRYFFVTSLSIHLFRHQS